MVDKAEQWKEEARNHFLKPTSEALLLDVLLPRSTALTPRRRHQNKKMSRQNKKEVKEENGGISEKLIDSVGIIDY